MIGGTFALAACGNDPIEIGPVELSPAALTVTCSPASEIPSGAWMCSVPRTLRCDELLTATIYVPTGDALACEKQGIELADNGPLVPGIHLLTVRSDNGAACSSALTVVDETPPLLTARAIYLWPSIHEFHSIDVKDCVTAHDDCDGDLKGEFIWASSDEPVNDVGDGNTQPDITLGDDCSHVSLRVKRDDAQGGRVYRLGVRVTDANGNQAEAHCLVLIDHGQPGSAAIDGDEAYRLLFDGADGSRRCPSLHAVL